MFQENRICLEYVIFLFLLIFQTTSVSSLEAEEIEYADSSDYLGGLTPLELNSLYLSPLTSTLSINEGRRQALPTNYRNAKILLYHAIRDENTLYCGCETFIDSSDEKFNQESCSYKPKNPNAWKGVLWAEHLLPAYWIAEYDKESTCWDSEQCESSESNRECCQRLDKKFSAAFVDLVNLYPTVDEVNRARNNHTFGEIAGENYAFGNCDFEYSNSNEVAEPRPEIRGDIARVYFYMAQIYGLEYPGELLEKLETWSELDPVDKGERDRNERVREIQGQANDGL